MMRRLILAALCALALPNAAAAQFTLVGQDYELCGGSAATCAFGTGVTAQAGDLVVVLMSNRDNVDISSVADGVNTGYTCPDGQDASDGGSGMRGMTCYFIASGAGTVTPTVTWASSSRGEGNFQVWRPTGTVTLDATVEGTEAATTSHVTSSLSTGANAALVLCNYAFSTAGTITGGAGYTKLTDGSTRWGGQYDITSVASGSFTCPLTTTNSVGGAALALSFNDSGGGGGGGSCTGGLVLLGAGKCE